MTIISGGDLCLIQQVFNQNLPFPLDFCQHTPIHPHMFTLKNFLQMGIDDVEVMALFKYQSDEVSTAFFMLVHRTPF